MTKCYDCDDLEEAIKSLRAQVATLEKSLAAAREAVREMIPIMLEYHGELDCEISNTTCHILSLVEKVRAALAQIDSQKGGGASE